MAGKTKYKFIELIAVSGGMSLGLRQAVFQPIFTKELSPMAAETYAHNLLEDKYLGENYES